MLLKQNIYKIKSFTQKWMYQRFSSNQRSSNSISNEIYSNNLEFLERNSREKIPTYRILNDDGCLINNNEEPKICKNILVQIMKTMVTLRILDQKVNEQQQKNAISFYLTSTGEEAAQIASVAALHDDDMVFCQYREPGVALWRHYNIEDMINQCFANKDDLNKGRQMPVHYGSKRASYFSISPCLGTQLPQSVGFAYMNKLSKNNQCTITYFGEGAASEGDAHAAFNFAATLKCPVIFFCRNNGYAISTPISEQYASEGIAVRGRSYGMMAIKVDGNDSLAVYTATKEARKICVDHNLPVLIEAMTYRVGKHTANETCQEYRSDDEIKYWKTYRDPIKKLNNFLMTKGWWNEEMNQTFETETQKNIMKFIENAKKKPKGNPLLMFEDVYDTIPMRLRNQMENYQRFLLKNISKYPKEFEPLENI